jgi:hypothetical protein
MSGPYNLGDRAISSAVTNEVITEGVSSAGVDQSYIDGLDWMAAVTLFVNFVYGSGGTTCVVTVQTSIDGVVWIDVARFDFTTASLSKVANLSGLTPVAAATVAALSSQGQTDGVLGDRLRARLTTTGTYAGNTSVSVRAVPR